jgi:hypothetical protein
MSNEGSFEAPAFMVGRLNMENPAAVRFGFSRQSHEQRP